MDSNAKYDRQLMLWGNEGQLLLEKAHVCIAGKSQLTQEVVKNLALPGTGRLTLINDTDEENNLFFGTDIRNLVALNPRVKVDELDWQQAIMCHSEFWSQFDLVIVSTRQTEILSCISALWTSEPSLPPLLLSYMHGFYGYVRFISSEPHCITQSHPQHKIPDLRLERPWDELLYHLDSLEIYDTDKGKLLKVPYAVLLFKALKSLRDKQQTITRESVKKELGMVFKETDLGLQDLNFLEAQRYAHLALFDSTDLPSNLKQIFDLQPQSVENIRDPTNREFWTLVRCLEHYLATDYSKSQLPLHGSIPDMESSTKNYNELKKIYLEKAEMDQKVFSELMRGLDPQISEKTIKSFCKNCRYLAVVQPSKTIAFGTSIENLSKSTADLALLLKLLLALQYYPERDVAKYVDSASASGYLSTLSKLHGKQSYPVASLMGGIVAQEASKILTHQYIPFQNTLVYDGINNKTDTFKL